MLASFVLTIERFQYIRYKQRAYCLKKVVRSLFIRSYLVFDRKRDLRLKQVAIDDQLELSALKSCQVFRDGKSKSASLRGSGNVTADESLGELIRADV